MTAAPIVTIAPVAAPDRADLARFTGAPDLRAFVEAARTALRFLDLPADARARVRGDLALIEQEAGRADIRPALVAGLRFAVETTIERHVSAL